jgi:membrane protein DedA with SNARE-associated domain
VSQYLDLVIAFVSSHGVVAYVVVFLCAFLEAVPLAGAIVPGSTVILALSALVPSGNLKLTPILVAAIAGAALGDGLAYWLGYTQKRRVLSLWPMSKYPALVAESERFFLRYGTFAVFFARFIPPIRAFVPFTAGALDMPPLKFIAVDALAVLAWAPAMILPGVLAGSAAEQWGAKAEYYALPLVCGLILAGTVAWSLRTWWRARRLAQSTSPFK